MNNGAIITASIINDAYEKLNERELKSYTEMPVTTYYKNNKLNRKLYPKHEVLGDYIEIYEDYLISYRDYSQCIMLQQLGIITDDNLSGWIKSKGIKK